MKNNKTTLRDRIAIKAMQSLIPEFYSKTILDWTNEEIAKEAYRMANEILKERERIQERESDKRYLKTPLIPKGGVIKCVIPCNEEMQMNGRCPCLKDLNFFSKPEFPKDRNESDTLKQQLNSINRISIKDKVSSIELTLNYDKMYNGIDRVQYNSISLSFNEDLFNNIIELVERDINKQ